MTNIWRCGLLLAVVAGCGPSEAERKHQAELKAILAKNTTAETRKFADACGPVANANQARECLTKRLGAWRRAETTSVRVRPADLLLAKLLDFTITDMVAQGAHFAATVNLQLELSGGVGAIGGGPAATRQMHYKIEKESGIIEMVD